MPKMTFILKDGSRKEVEAPLGLSVLEIAHRNHVDIEGACEGSLACSTCHVVVREGLDTCNESEEAEEDQLEKAPGLTPQSRLACQCVPDGRKNLIVEVPNWNRNLVRE